MKRFTRKALRLMGIRADGAVTSWAGWIKKLSLTILAGVVAALGVANVARAIPFDVQVAGLVLVNTNPDMDLFFLTQFVGVFPNQPLSYGATITAAGFTGNMSGIYGGESLDISYEAIPIFVTPTSLGLAWSSTGSYGAQVWSGNGSAAFTFLTPTTFEEAYSYSMTLGSNTAEASLLINGVDSSGLVEYTGTSGNLTINGDVIVLPLPAVGIPFNTITLPYIGPLCPGTKCPGENDLHFRRGVLDFLILSSMTYAPPDLTPLSLVGIIEIQAVPEPSSIALFGTGIFGLLGYAWKNRKRLNLKR